MADAQRPNFVFILTDQQRRDSLGCYGNQVAQTPNLDKLAADGVAFDSAFCANVVCSPSRASIITGRYPRAHGHTGPHRYSRANRDADAGSRSDGDASGGGRGRGGGDTDG